MQDLGQPQLMARPRDLLHIAADHRTGDAQELRGQNKVKESLL